MITDQELDIIISESLETNLEIFSEGIFPITVSVKGILIAAGLIASHAWAYSKGVDNSHGGGMIGGMALGAALALIWSQYRKLRQKYGTRCDGLIGEERKKCFQMVDSNAIVKPLNLLTQVKSKCSTSNNPEECKKRVDQKIKELKSQKL
jgi:hypothetical protein